jgi:predicted regulator of Ras-like GTPase activity (Roadblock/LC7/MglB family)
MFHRSLNRMLAGVEGSIAAMFLDHEGEAVAVVGEAASTDELKIIGAYHGIHVNQLQRLSGEMVLGEPRRFKVDLGKYRLLTATLKDGYYLVVVLERHANEGIAWRALAGCRDELLGEI